MKVRTHEHLFNRWKEIGKSHPCVKQLVDTAAGLFQNDMEVDMNDIEMWAQIVSKIEQTILEEAQAAVKTIRNLTEDSFAQIRREVQDNHSAPLYTAYADGVCVPNPGDMGIGGYILDPEGKCVEFFSHKIGEGTNNRAEYFAVLQCVTLALKNGIKNLTIYTDSKLVANQYNGEWKVKDEDLLKMWAPLHKAGSICNLKIVWIPREKNEQADTLSQEALFGKQTQTEG